MSSPLAQIQQLRISWFSATFVLTQNWWWRLYAILMRVSIWTVWLMNLKFDCLNIWLDSKFSLKSRCYAAIHISVHAPQTGQSFIECTLQFPCFHGLLKVCKFFSHPTGWRFYMHTNCQELIGNEKTRTSSALHLQIYLNFFPFNHLLYIVKAKRRVFFPLCCWTELEIQKRVGNSKNEGNFCVYLNISVERSPKLLHNCWVSRLICVNVSASVP